MHRIHQLFSVAGAKNQRVSPFGRISCSTPLPSGSMTVTSPSGQNLGTALSDLRSHKEEWTALGLRERIRLLEVVIRRTDFAAGRWVEAASARQGIRTGFQSRQ